MRSVNSQSRAVPARARSETQRSPGRTSGGVARWQRPRDVVAHALHQHNQRRTESNRRCSDEQSTALTFVACRNGRTERSKRDPREKWIQPGCHQVLKPFDRVVNDDPLSPNRRALPCVHRMRSAHHSNAVRANALAGASERRKGCIQTPSVNTSSPSKLSTPGVQTSNRCGALRLTMPWQKNRQPALHVR